MASTTDRHSHRAPHQQSSDDDETAPLLSHFPPRSPLLNRRSLAKDLYVRTIFIILALIITVEFATILQTPPSVRLFEIIYCREYYQLHNPGLIDEHGVVKEELCKVDAVQHKLASLRGWYSFFQYLPGVLLAIPYGILADRYGRKWLMLLNMVAFELAAAWLYLVCAFPQILPIRTVWLSGIAGIFGGGSLVCAALIYVIASDISSKSQLTSTFLRLNAASLFCFSAAPALSGFLMQYNVWLPMNIGLSLQLLAIPICLFLPETLGLRKENDEPNSSGPPPNDVTALPDHLSSSPPPSINFEKGSLFQRIRFLSSSALHNSAFLFRDWRILYLAALYPFWGSLNDLNDLLLQYIPKRYYWSYARSTYLYSLHSATGMLTLLFILPWTSSYLLTHRSFTPPRKDLFLFRAGLAFSSTGLFLQGIAPHSSVLLTGLVLASLGAGIAACARALLTSYVQQDEVARLYSAIALVSAIGSMIGGPILSGIFNAGLGYAETGRSVWLGLPWIAEAAVLCVFAVSAWMMRLQGDVVEKSIEGLRGVFPDGLERVNEGLGFEGGGMAGGVVVMEEDGSEVGR